MRLLAFSVFKQGEGREEEGDREGANVHFARLAEEFPEDESAQIALYRIAENLRALGREAEAARAYERLARRYQGSEYARGAMVLSAQLFSTLGDWRAAAQNYEDLYRADPDDADAPEALFRAARAVEQGGAREEAVRLWREFAERFPAEPRAAEARFREAELLLALGRPDEARARFAAVWESAPGPEADPYRARAALALGKLSLEQFEAVALRGELAGALERKEALLEAALGRLAEAAGLPYADTFTEALYRGGAGLRAPQVVAAGLGAARGALRRGARGVRLPPGGEGLSPGGAGGGVLPRGLAAARRAGVHTAWVDRMYARLEALVPVGLPAHRGAGLRLDPARAGPRGRGRRPVRRALAALAAATVLALAGCASGPPPLPARRTAGPIPERPPAPPPTAPPTAPERLAAAREALATGDFAAAAREAREAAVADPLLVEARLLEVEALEAAGDVPGAVGRRADLVRDGVGGDEAVRAYATAALRQGAGEEALDILAAEAEARPADAGLRGAAAWVALALGRPTEARRLLEPVAGAPGAGRNATYLGRARLLEGDLAGAAEMAERAVSLPGAGESEWVLLGDVRRRQGLAAAAAEAYRRALEAEPRGYDARVNLAVLRLVQGDAAGAEALSVEAAELAPGRPEAWTNLGLAHRARGAYEGARAAYERALEAAPGYPPALKNLGILNEKYRGRPADAIPLYDRYAEQRPEDETVRQWRKAAERRSAEEAP